jgi:hypothetical protein
MYFEYRKDGISIHGMEHRDRFFIQMKMLTYSMLKFACPTGKFQLLRVLFPLKHGLLNSTAQEYLNLMREIYVRRKYETLIFYRYSWCSESLISGQARAPLHKVTLSELIPFETGPG